MGVPLHAPADHAAFEHVEGGKQSGRAVPLRVCPRSKCMLTELTHH